MTNAAVVIRELFSAGVLGHDVKLVKAEPLARAMSNIDGHPFHAYLYNRGTYTDRTGNLTPEQLNHNLHVLHDCLTKLAKRCAIIRPRKTRRIRVKREYGSNKAVPPSEPVLDNVRKSLGLKDAVVAAVPEAVLRVSGEHEKEAIYCLARFFQDGQLHQSLEG